jgi:23S rRNA pseudouridine2605 synthase
MEPLCPSPPPRKTSGNLKIQRLNKVLSAAGITSRRKADEWIIKGRVTVNGQLITQLGFRVAYGEDRICVDGKELQAPLERVYIMLNKPFAYISSLNDPEGRPVVTDLLQGIPQRIYPVGRLDFDSLGLLLFTNDGEWTYRLTHPSYQIPRTYKATVEGEIHKDTLDILRRGVQLDDGPSGPATATLIGQDRGRSQVRMTITQGRPRQVRRMFDAINCQVIHLIRIGFGSLRLGDLKVGKYRHLATDEVYKMKNSVGLV